MARGRKTGGREKGTPNKKNADLIAKVKSTGITPLEYMLKVLRDRNAPLDRRDDMAKAAAPYIHPRLQATEHSGNVNLTYEQFLGSLPAS